jgi:lincosamide and streptogramin A transport system ATP-binding/permease protein
LKIKNGFLIVSHDRQFIDEVVDHILSINKANIALEKGNYSSWKKNREMAEDYEFRTKARLEREVEALEKESVRSRSWAAIAEKEKNPFATNNRGNGSRAAKFMRQAKSAEQDIQDNLKEKKSLLKNYEVTADLVMKQQEMRSGSLISAYDLSFGYGGESLFEKMSFCISKGDRIWIRGRNGAGKSTLLKLISGLIPCERIQLSDHIVMETAFQEPLWTKGYINDLIKDTEIRSRFLDICHRLDVKHEVLKRPLETFSSGEQKKIDIARALASPCQLLLLDEPLNFMDIYFREQLEKAILIYQPTIVFVEHDELFGNHVATGEIVLK